MICPIMSIRMIAWSGEYVECQEKDCMWYAKCKPKETARSEEGHAFKEKEDVLNFIEEILNSSWYGGGNHLSDWEIGYKAGLMDIKEKLSVG